MLALPTASNAGFTHRPYNTTSNIAGNWTVTEQTGTYEKISTGTQTVNSAVIYAGGSGDGARGHCLEWTYLAGKNIVFAQEFGSATTANVAEHVIYLTNANPPSIEIYESGGAAKTCTNCGTVTPGDRLSICIVNDGAIYRHNALDLDCTNCTTAGLNSNAYFWRMYANDIGSKFRIVHKNDSVWDEGNTTNFSLPNIPDNLGAQIWGGVSIEGTMSLETCLPGLPTSTYLRFEGTDGSTTFDDSSLANHTWTTAADEQIDTAQFKFGTSSGLFDGTADRIIAADNEDWDLFGSASDDWTISFWVRHASTGAQEVYASQFTTAGNDGWRIYKTTGDVLRSNLWVSASQYANMQGTTTLSTGTWYHVAFVKVGPEHGLYLDGTQEAYVSDTQTGTFAEVMRVGGLQSASADSMDGWIDDFLMVKGNMFQASPNVGLTDTITVPVAEQTQCSQAPF